MYIFTRWWTLLVLQCIFLGGVFPVYALRLRCADCPVAFEYEESRELKCVCLAARAAIAFLKTLGLETTEVITIRLVDSFPAYQMHNLIGCYNPTSHEVQLLTYAKAKSHSQGNKSMLNIDASEDIWCSYAAHELAHAVSNQYLDNNKTAGEYISAVTQLSVLTPESREKVLKKYQNLKAYKSIQEISALYYLFAPNEFAVKCYLHFVSLDKPKEFIERILKEENEFWERF